MEAGKIFSKLNIRDYNNELEKILDKKQFSEDAKNILLSMLYKIENAYKDYENIKVATVPKKDFLEYLLNTIKVECLNIELLKPNQNEYNYIVEAEKGKISCYPNEKILLSAILDLGKKVDNGNTLHSELSNIYEFCDKDNFRLEYEPVKNAINEMINIGYNDSNTQVIRDFNGWSWDIVTKEIESIFYNIVYQSVLILGKENVRVTEKFSDLVIQLCVQIYVRNYKESEDVQRLLKIKEDKNDELAKIQDKRCFVQNLTNEKRKYSSEIENIDKILNDSELLKKEYSSRNKKLPNKEKIFSISYLEDILQKERNELLDKIKKANKMLDPMEFVKEKDKIQKEAYFFNLISFDETKNDLKDEITEFCSEFLKCSKYIIGDLQDKESIIKWIYKIRYYKFIPISDTKYLKDVKKLDEDFEEVIKLIIKKAKEYKLWEEFSEDKELEYEVLKVIFESKTINLENVNIECKYENKILKVNYYDTNILEETIEMPRQSVKIKKKIKLFI